MIAARCAVATGFFQRLRGLIGRTEFPEGEGLLFPRCSSIHLWFMRIPIDVVFLTRGAARRDASGRTVHRISSVHEGLLPWKVLPVSDGQAGDTLELPAGTIRRCGLRAGDDVCIS